MFFLTAKSLNECCISSLNLEK